MIAHDRMFVPFGEIKPNGTHKLGILHVVHICGEKCTLLLGNVNMHHKTRSRYDGGQAASVHSLMITD